MRQAILCLLIIFAFIPILSWAKGKAGPRMFIAEPVFDAGKVDQGTTISHDFTIKNTGDEELKITKVDTDWGCTLADYDKVIAPGGSGIISIKVKTEAYFSPIVKSAEVISNDPKNSEAKIQIKAQVINYIKISPPIVYIRKSDDTITDAIATISTDRKTPMTLDVESFTIPDKVKYTIEETIKGKEFKVTFSPTLESEEAFKGVLTLRTNYKDKPILRIFVRSRFE